MEKLRGLLAENNLDLGCLVMVNVFLSDIQMFERFNEYYSQEMVQPWPPRKLVEAKMSKNGITIEMTAIAHRKKQGGKTNEDN